MVTRKRGKTRNPPSSPTRDRTPGSAGFDIRPPSPSHPTAVSPPSAALLDRQFTAAADDDFDLFSTDFPEERLTNPNPRSFPYNVKKQCWEKAEKIKGRDPDRWRRDYLGNIVFRKLVGCAGCLCHDYDHIVPYSKGGASTLENCQVLQARVNRSKGNRTEVSRADLIQKSSYCRVSGRDMDLLELSAYGNVRHEQDPRRCSIL